MSVITKLGSFVFKGGKSVAMKDFCSVSKNSFRCIKDLGKSIPDSFVAVEKNAKNVVNSSKSTLKEILENYNLKKLADSRKFGTSERIINNWQEAFGVANKNGVYQNAIDHLNKVGAIDDYILKLCPNVQKGSKEFTKLKSLLSDFLGKKLDVYSYKRIDGILRSFDSQISKHLSNGAVIYVPDPNKSSNIITTLYKSINPDAKVVTGYQNLTKYFAEGGTKKIVVLDDCLVTGSQAEKLMKNLADMPNIIGKGVDVDMYVLSGYKKGLKAAKGVNVHTPDGTFKDFLIESQYFRDLPSNDKGLLLMLLGKGSKYSAYSAEMFPYMTPNNNCSFATNMIKNLFSGPECALKGIFNEINPNLAIEQVAKKAVA